MCVCVVVWQTDTCVCQPLVGMGLAWVVLKTAVTARAVLFCCVYECVIHAFSNVSIHERVT